MYILGALILPHLDRPLRSDPPGQGKGLQVLDQLLHLAHRVVGRVRRLGGGTRSDASPGCSDEFWVPS